MTPDAAIDTAPMRAGTETVPSPSQRAVKVLYLLGMGRSGSTLLDAALSNHPHVLGTGELMKWVRNGIVKNHRCACGAPVPTCEFWAAAFAEWTRRVPFDAHAFLSRQDYYEDVPPVDYRPRLLHRRVQARAFHSPEFELYARETLAAFQALREVSGRNVIVDSSKTPERARALARVPGIDLHLVHLVRDVRGVVYSKAKRVPKDEAQGKFTEEPGLPVWKTCVQWCSINLRSERLRKRLPRHKSMLLRYEDFVLHPKQSLIAIGQLAGCDLAALGDTFERGDALQVGHTVAGNHLRMSGRIRLRHDDAWRAHLSPSQLLQIRLISGWMMRRYAYA